MEIAYIFYYTLAYFSYLNKVRVSIKKMPQWPLIKFVNINQTPGFLIFQTYFKPLIMISALYTVDVELHPHGIAPIY